MDVCTASRGTVRRCKPTMERRFLLDFKTPRRDEVILVIASELDAGATRHPGREDAVTRIALRHPEPTRRAAARGTSSVWLHQPHDRAKDTKVHPLVQRAVSSDGSSNL